MSDYAAYYSNLHRGQLLRESARYQEACTFLSDAIQADPEQPEAYLELALAQEGLPGNKTKSLQAIDRAVALAPNSAHFLGFKAHFLSNRGKNKEALGVACQALEIDPCCRVALIAQANAFTKLAQWTKAEESARRILELNAVDTEGLNLLAQALRFQNRRREARDVTSEILARIPNDAFAQANAGWEALKGDDHIRANEHFLNALRVDPNCEYARGGLLQSLRCRIWVYRVNLAILSKLAEVGENLGRIVAITCFLSGGLLLGPILLYVALALTLQPLSNFFLLFDPKGYRALKTKERYWALFTGGTASILLLIFALTNLIGLFWIVGIYLFLFAFTVYLPQWGDAWRAWRDERLIATENFS